MLGHMTSIRSPEDWWDSGESSTANCFLPAVKKLPKDLRKIGYALLGCDADGNLDQIDRAALRAFQFEQAVALDRLEGARLRRLLTAVLRSMAEPAEAAWQWMRSLPLPAELCEAPFRAPLSTETAGDELSQLEYWALAYRWHWLVQIIGLAAPYEGSTLSPAWLATWSTQFHRSLDEPIAFMLAAVVDKGGPEGDEVFEILLRAVTAHHTANGTAGHAIRALLCASREQGWHAVRQLLIAATPPENVLPLILAAMRYAPAGALSLMFQAIAEHQLVRHLEVVQLIDQWLGLSWATPGSKDAHDTVLDLVAMMHHQGDLADVLRPSNGTAEQRARRAYLALWTMACRDAAQSVVHAEALLGAAEVELRYAAAWHLARLPLPQAHAARCRALDDVDLRVALCSLHGALPPGRPGPAYATDPAMFEPLERLVLRMPTSPIALKPLVWPWTGCMARRDVVARELMAALGSRSPRQLIPHLEAFDGRDRRIVVERLAEQQPVDEESRWTLLRLVADAEPDVSQAALVALARAGVTADDAIKLEGIAKWLPEELQPMVIDLLLSLPDEAAIASAIRLLHARNRDQRYMGLRLLQQLAESDRRRSECISVTRTWLAGRRRHQPREQLAIDAILASAKAPATLDTALGMMNPAGRSQGVPPVQRPLELGTPTVQRLLKSLDQLVHKHRQEPIACAEWGQGTEWVPLGEIGWRFPAPDFARPAASQLGHLPLAAQWEAWYAAQCGQDAEANELDLLRAAIYLKLIEPGLSNALKAWSQGSRERQELLKQLLPEADRPALKYASVLPTLVDWLLLAHPPADGLDFLLDGLETVAAGLSKVASLNASADDEALGSEYADWREMELVSVWSAAIEELTDLPLLPPSNEHVGRYWRLLRWLDEPAAGVPRQRPSFPWLVRAYLAGQATVDDVADHLLGSRPLHGMPWSSNFGSLAQVTAPEPAPELTEFLQQPEIAELVDRCTTRLLQFELSGDASPAVHQAASAVLAFRGVHHLRKLLAAWPENNHAVHAEVDGHPHTRVTSLIARTYPALDETPEQCGEVLRQAIATGELSAQRLLELPFMAPQWLDAVTAAIGWPGLADAFYWALAHRRYIWGVEPPAPPQHAEDDLGAPIVPSGAGASIPPHLSRWERAIRERTLLTAAERAEGAVDVAWFHRVRQTLSPEQWQAVLAAAHRGASPAQVQRAMFIFDVLVGNVARQALVEGIERRHIQENVRLLGLLPLGPESHRHEELAIRNRVMQHYRAHLESLGGDAKREAADALAVGLRNLAATAGYPDQLLLRLAVEATSVADWLDNGARLLYDDLTLGLFVDPQGHPRFDIRQSGRLLKTVPRSVKSVPEIVAMRSRATRLRRDTSGIAASLEAAMCRGASFTGQQLQHWAAHATLGPRLSRLVMVCETRLGYPAAGGTMLQDYAGRQLPLDPQARLRIAHPADIAALDDLSAWKDECLQAERQQPIRQLFRELYEPGDDERAEDGLSRRFAGRRLRMDAALAAWARRHWLLDEHGRPIKTFPADGITATLNVYAVQGEFVELQTLAFRTPQGQVVACHTVPLRIFSEVVRELVAVVAAAQGSDVPAPAARSKMHPPGSSARHNGGTMRRWLTAKNN